MSLLGDVKDSLGATVRGLADETASAFESRAQRKEREDLISTSETWKVISIAGLIVSVATAFFCFLIMAIGAAIVKSFAAVICYDSWTVHANLIKLLSSPSEYYGMIAISSDIEKSVNERACKNTFILKYFYT